MNISDVREMIATGKFISLKELSRHRIAESQWRTVYGQGFSYTDNKNGTINVPQDWANRNIVGLPTVLIPGFPPTSATGKVAEKIWCHYVMAPALYWVFKELKKRNIDDKLRTFDGSWVPRHQYHDLSRPLSIHTPGLGLDLDVKWNPSGTTGNFLEPKFIHVMEMCGFQWGGRWKSNLDPMHFQYTDPLPGVVTPEWQDGLLK